jgi:transposase-like protein
MQEPSTVEVVGQASPWKEGLEAAIRERVREVIEEILREEVEEALGARRSQRAVGRCGYRHGKKVRGLALRSGAVKLAVPRARLVNSDGDEREWRSELLPRYRRSSPEVEQAVLGVYLSGGNTRRIRGALKPLLSGAPLSKSAVSRLVNRLEESYERWRQRDLAEERIVYLYLDAIYPKVPSGGKVVSLPVLVALGVKPTGEKVLLALAIAGAETGAAWQMMLEDLAARHLGRPRLVISDGNPGLKSALERIWPGVAHQRCTVHKLRNPARAGPRPPSMPRRRCMKTITGSSTPRIVRRRKRRVTAS